jgi:hypothetical protein
MQDPSDRTPIDQVVVQVSINKGGHHHFLPEGLRTIVRDFLFSACIHRLFPIVDLVWYGGVVGDLRADLYRGVAHLVEVPIDSLQSELSRCPWRGLARKLDMVMTVVATSNQPIWITHCSAPTIDWNRLMSSSSSSLELSISGWSPCSSGDEYCLGLDPNIRL